jgi:hypothetical protein
LLRIEGWARDGLTDEQIAHNMGIAAGTLYAWQKDHDEIYEAIKKGKAPVDIEVENALFKRATGYTVRVQKPVKVKTKRQLKDKGTIEEEHIEFVEEEIYIAPDTTAQIYWLKNRRPDKWRDKPQTGAVDTDDPLMAMLKRWDDAAGE